MCFLIVDCGFKEVFVSSYLLELGQTTASVPWISPVSSASFLKLAEKWQVFITMWVDMTFFFANRNVNTSCGSNWSTGSLEVLATMITDPVKYEQFPVAKSGCYLCMNYLVGEYILQSFL